MILHIDPLLSLHSDGEMLEIEEEARLADPPHFLQVFLHNV